MFYKHLLCAKHLSTFYTLNLMTMKLAHFLVNPGYERLDGLVS